MSLLADLTLRSSSIVLIGLAATLALRQRSAAWRHAVLATTMFAAGLTLPLAMVLPSWSVPAPRATGSKPASPSMSSSIEVEATRSAATVSARSTRAGFVSRVVVVAWAGGVFLYGAVFLTSVGRLRRITRQARRARDDSWERMALEISAAYRLRRRVVVCHTEAPDLLATVGVFRPRVLLPAQAGGWNDDRVRVVLCHELAHIRRHDWIVQMSAEVLRIVFWFNPLFHAACGRLRRESEQACDDEVLGSGVRAQDYAAHLLALARSCRRASLTWAGATPMARPSTLERRFAAMLNPALNRTPPSRRALVLTAVLVLAVTLPAAAFRARQAPLPLAGSVYDTTGAVLPAVALTVEDDRQNKWQAETDASGHFEFPQLQAGRYVLEASLPGFRALRHEFELRSARDWDRAITLQVGEVRESIAVREQRTNGLPAAAAPQGPQRIRVGGNIRVPRKLVDVRPVYPPSMRDAGREGVVPIEAIIGPDGAVHSVRVLSANIHPDFAIAAADAVRQWRFIPTLLNGVPVEVTMTVTVKFSLSE
jgi:TonB family protein